MLGLLSRMVASASRRRFLDLSVMSEEVGCVDKRYQAVPPHVIAQEPEVVPDCPLQLATGSKILNLQLELLLQCLHVNSPSVCQPALVVVQLLSDSACTFLLHFRCHLHPSSFGLDPVFEFEASQPCLQEADRKITSELELMEFRQVELLQ